MIAEIYSYRQQQQGGFMRYAAICLGALLSACAYNPPIMTAPESYTRMLPGSLSDAWKKSADTLTAKGFALAVSDKNIGMMNTAKKVVTVTAAQVDCGGTLGFPYVGDSRTAVRASLSVKLSPEQNGTRMTVSSDIEASFVAHAGATALPLNCRSLGYLEQNFLDAF